MPSRVKLLGELALRVNDVPAMKSFYRDVVGLEVLEDGPGYAFLVVAEGAEGHPQLLVLFDREVEVGQAASTLDHFAFVIDLDDYGAEKGRLEGMGVAVTLRQFPHFGWRSLFFKDPEGNTVEFVAYDAEVKSAR